MAEVQKTLANGTSKALKTALKSVPAEVKKLYSGPCVFKVRVPVEVEVTLFSDGPDGFARQIGSCPLFRVGCPELPRGGAGLAAARRRELPTPVVARHSAEFMRSVFGRLGPI